MDRQKAQRKLKADLPRKYTGKDREEKELFEDYLLIMDPVWPVEDVLKYFADDCGLTYLARKAQEKTAAYASNRFVKRIQSAFL